MALCDMVGFTSWHVCLFWHGAGRGWVEGISQCRDGSAWSSFWGRPVWAIAWELSSCHGQIRQQGHWWAGGGRLAQMRRPGCPVLSLEAGKRGQSARSWPRCQVSALAGRRSEGPSMVRTNCLRVGAWIPLLPGHTALSFVNLMPWTWSLPDAPRHSTSLGKQPGQSGLWSPFRRRDGAFPPARGTWVGEGILRSCRTSKPRVYG